MQRHYYEVARLWHIHATGLGQYLAIASPGVYQWEGAGLRDDGGEPDNSAEANLWIEELS